MPIRVLFSFALLSIDSLSTLTHTYTLKMLHPDNTVKML